MNLPSNVDELSPGTTEATLKSPLNNTRASIEDDHGAAIRQLLEGETAWDRRLIAGSNWLNPIVVKECRQALKSKQFSITLVLLTVIVLAFSILAIVGMIPSIYYASNGTGLLMGYAIILIVPALVIIPQATFWSMAAELRDGTFETLSLTSLTPRMILMGKLGVAALQLMIYLSVVTPCIALTYLLRGVTLDVLSMTLLILISSSLFLSTIAISVAAFTRNSLQQVFFSIVMLAAQIVVSFIGGSFILSLVSIGTIPIEGWISFGCLVLGMLLYGWLLLRCGGCAIDVASENRSTPIRVPLFVIGLLMSMLVGFFSISYGDRSSMQEVLGVGMNFLFFHWAVAGSIMMGEQGLMPARARRTLPSSLLGRLLLTWFNPGAGPGYIFVLLSFLGSVVTLALGPMLLIQPTKTNVDVDLSLYALALFGLLGMYLGVVRLMFIALLRKLTQGRLAIAFTIQLVLIVLSVVVSLSLSLFVNNYRTPTFEWFCFINPFWLLSETFPQNGNTTNSVENVLALIALGVTSSFIMFLNVLLVAKDVTIVRIETPERVTRERKKGRANQVEEQVDWAGDRLEPT